jgi:predicted secreted protein
LSPQRRRQVENELIQQALDAFSERARLIAGQLGRPDYRLVHITVGGRDDTPRPRYQSAVMSMQAEAASVPSLEPGTQTVEIQANGTIELTVQ